MTAIEPKWLVEFAPKFYKQADAASALKRKRGEKLEPLYDKFRQDHRPTKRK